MHLHLYTYVYDIFAGNERQISDKNRFGSYRPREVHQIDRKAKGKDMQCGFRHSLDDES